MLGSAARIRVSSVTWRLSSSGTLKSTRIRTRLPLKSRSVIDSFGITFLLGKGEGAKGKGQDIPFNRRLRRKLCPYPFAFCLYPFARFLTVPFPRGNESDQRR